MAILSVKENQKPSEDTLRRLAELKDEDITYDEDCPQLTPEMEKALERATAQRNRTK